MTHRRIPRVDGRNPVGRLLWSVRTLTNPRGSHREELMTTDTVPMGREKPLVEPRFCYKELFGSKVDKVSNCLTGRPPLCYRGIILFFGSPVQGGEGKWECDSGNWKDPETTESTFYP